MSMIAEDIQVHWNVVRPLFSIRNEREYDLAIERLNALIDEVGANGGIRRGPPSEKDVNRLFPPLGGG